MGKGWVWLILGLWLCDSVRVWEFSYGLRVVLKFILAGCGNSGLRIFFVLGLSPTENFCNFSDMHRVQTFESVNDFSIPTLPTCLVQISGNDLANGISLDQIVTNCQQFRQKCLDQGIFVGFVSDFIRVDIDPTLSAALTGMMQVAGLFVYNPEEENELLRQQPGHFTADKIHLRHVIKFSVKTSILFNQFFYIKFAENFFSITAVYALSRLQNG